MLQTLDNAQVIAALRHVAQALTAQAETLRELDAAIGDGDLGITVTLGFQALVEGLPALEAGDIANTLVKSGMAFNRKAASTFGALFATMMMRAARAAKGRASLDLAALAEMAQAAIEGVQERGKAALGDKTLLDALAPAAQALAAAAQAGATLAEGLIQAAAAAEQGALATREMKSKIGRASWFAERTGGIQDPGATAMAMMFAAVQDFITA